MFSPNFLKSKYYAQKGMMENSKNEIFSHFFRRGNQGIYDCLLSDMQFCEDYLYSSFKQLLMEHSFIDVAVAPTTDWKFSDKDDEIEVSINNRSAVISPHQPFQNRTTPSLSTTSLPPLPKVSFYC